MDTIPDFLDRMVQADRLLLALDALGSRGEAQAVGMAMRDAVRVYAELVALRDAHPLTDGESIRLQIALDRIRARLKFFGQSVQR
ncbi:MAG TPA: hypothetical protein VMD92_07865 [Acidobacteriaceae bacterium]|nr:hypothetical protein [Acidobacteriaceae bacterium]